MRNDFISEFFGGCANASTRHEIERTASRIASVAASFSNDELSSGVVYNK
jgi:hypothetical protein